MFTRRRYLLAASLACLLWAFSPAQAELFVTVGDLDLPVGSVGNIDVTITSDNGTDLLDIFGAEFTIATSGTTQLQFVSPPSDPQLGTGRYLFFGDSAGALAPPVGWVVPRGDTYLGGDGTLSGSGVAVPLAAASPSLDKLLVTLQVMGDPANLPGVGDRFTIRLVTAHPNTFFFTPSFADIPFGSTPGEVRIVTPEPSDAALLLLGALMLLAWRITTRRSA